MMIPQQKNRFFIPFRLVMKQSISMLFGVYTQAKHVTGKKDLFQTLDYSAHTGRCCRDDTSQVKYR